MMESMLPVSLRFAGKARSNVALLEFRFFGFGFVWCWSLLYCLGFF